ncbi:uncharacterized protein B0I36DRAFT_339311 [Microdochium trichocladiopsis]|uniref:Uncharacterized protein n=1 Tax=Microdochium trichocladiopsis TaxID=1682393 RepID=A0A9P8XQV8_9PEZI|nr:uncharacterized protein B0I36DRAFT_339311 [Microdochium trichocladiopsis]KAH7012462.1 hypothetical protein B0I36DRAFT_339311 [Microdochium trichocladiopsis]
MYMPRCHRKSGKNETQRSMDGDIFVNPNGQVVLANATRNNIDTPLLSVKTVHESKIKPPKRVYNIVECSYDS